MSEDSPPYGAEPWPTCPTGTHAFPHPVVDMAVCHCGTMVARVSGSRVVVSAITHESAPYELYPRVFSAVPENLLRVINADGTIEWGGGRWSIGGFRIFGAAGRSVCWELECFGPGPRRSLYWYDDALHAEKPAGVV